MESEPPLKTLEFPRLRALEAVSRTPDGKLVLQDATGLAGGTLVVDEAQMELLSLLDGSRGLHEVTSVLAVRTGLQLAVADLKTMLSQLGDAGYLEGDSFTRFYASRRAAYLQAPVRPLRHPDGYGAPASELAGYLDRIMADAAPGPVVSGRLRGLVTPHLDFPRGSPCYGAAYRLLREALRKESGPLRVVVLGTNHFGCSQSVVATTKPFQTQWGAAPTDAVWIERLEAELGGSLRLWELDHVREHSVELQAIWLHHLCGERVSVVPFLCPDPSGPRGTAPGDPGGVDLAAFARALGALAEADPIPTLFLASADLSHVGRYFGDDLDLGEQELAEIGAIDLDALEHLDAASAEGLRRHMSETGNPTRHCSVGCLYALLTALNGSARPTRLAHHLAHTLERENLVSCVAYAFTD